MIPETARDLARRIVAAPPDVAVAMLGERSAEEHLALARALHGECYDAWSTEPARTQPATWALDALYRRANLPEIGALAAWSAGIGRLVAGDMESAITCLDDAGTRLAELGQAHAAAESQVPKLIALAMLGRHTEAEACAQRVRDEFLRADDERAAGKVELNLGSMLLRRDRYSEAAQLYRQAGVRFARVGDNEHSVMADIGLADTLASQFELREALHIYSRARARAMRHGLPVLSALVDGGEGLLELYRGHYHRALTLLEAARRQFDALALPQRQMVAERDLADAYLAVHLLPEAITLYDRVIETGERTGAAVEVAWGHLQRGRALTLLGLPEQAQTGLDRAGELFEQQGNHVVTGLVQLWRAEIVLQQQGPLAAEAAGALASRLLGVAGLVGWKLLADCVVARAALARADLDGARASFTAILDQAQQHGLRQVEMICHAGLGDVARSAGDDGAARTNYERAIEMFELQRAALPGDEFRMAFRGAGDVPYESLLELEFRHDEAIRGERVLAAMERARAWSLLYESRQGARTADATGDSEHETARVRLNRVHHLLQRAVETNEDPLPLQAQARALEAALLETHRRGELARDTSALGSVAAGLDQEKLRQALGTKTAVVAYHPCADGLAACVTTGQGTHAARLDARGLDDVMRQLRFQLDAMRFGAKALHAQAPLLGLRAQAHLETLYRLLLEPLAPWLRKVSRIVFIPHGRLRDVPFAALVSDGCPLVERVEVVYAPSAAFLLNCLNRPASRWESALIVGAHAGLHHVAREVETVAGCFARARRLVGPESTLASVRASAPQFDVLHFACHGRFRADSPYFSALHLEEGVLTVRDAQALPLTASLVTLSACESGLAEEAPGDERNGLVRGFLLAGAPAVLATLWMVDDETAAAQMATFYRGLGNGLRPAAALRQAQLELRRTHPHPYHWAAFVLTGRW